MFLVDTVHITFLTGQGRVFCYPEAGPRCGLWSGSRFGRASNTSDVSSRSPRSRQPARQQVRRARRPRLLSDRRRPLQRDAQSSMPPRSCCQRRRLRFRPYVRHVETRGYFRSGLRTPVPCPSTTARTRPLAPLGTRLAFVNLALGVNLILSKPVQSAVEKWLGGVPLCRCCQLIAATSDDRRPPDQIAIGELGSQDIRRSSLHPGPCSLLVRFSMPPCSGWYIFPTHFSPPVLHRSLILLLYPPAASRLDQLASNAAVLLPTTCYPLPRLRLSPQLRRRQVHQRNHLSVLSTRHLPERCAIQQVIRTIFHQSLTFHPTTDGQNPHSSCQAAQAGDYACGPQTVNGNPCYGATTQTPCPTGYYAPSSGTAVCTKCAAGHKCPGTGQTTQQACSPGEYVDTDGYSGQSCIPCPAGTFNNVCVQRSQVHGPLY